MSIVGHTSEIRTAANWHRLWRRLNDGFGIEDMMQATEWQQHSVRGFLAGTVKKKMGLALTSSKAEGDFRRYRIATRRGR